MSIWVTGVPLPCVSVDLKRGFAVMNPGPKHLLLVPTARVQGVESRQLLDVNAPNYFEYAWESRSYLDKELRVNLTRDEVGLAINSAQGRTQDQLHIHVEAYPVVPGSSISSACLVSEV